MSPSRAELQAVIGRWLDGREWVEDCTCDDDDPNGWCWYHLSPTEQRESRVNSLADLLVEAYGG